MRSLGILLIAGLLWVGAGAAVAQEMGAPRLAIVLLRVLAYDRNLTARADSPLKVGVVYPVGSEAALGHARALHLELVALSARMSVSGQRFQSELLGIRSAPGLEEAMGQGRWAALYLTSGLDSHLEGIRTLTRRRSVLTLTAVREYVDAGISIAVVAGKPAARLVISASAARAEGAQMAAPFLQLAEVLP